MTRMTDDETHRYAARHGLAPVAGPDLARLQELAERAAATGASIQRMVNKTDEPAGVFRVPHAHVLSA